MTNFRGFEMDGYNVYTDEEETNNLCTVENVEGYEYEYYSDATEFMDMEAFKEHVREQMSSFYHQN